METKSRRPRETNLRNDEAPVFRGLQVEAPGIECGQARVERGRLRPSWPPKFPKSGGLLGYKNPSRSRLGPSRALTR
jgi:hypothetical protein